MRKSRKFELGNLTYLGIEYRILFSTREMLRDENLSWTSKGYLSAIMFLPEGVDLSIPVIEELIEFGYLVEEVK